MVAEELPEISGDRNRFRVAVLWVLSASFFCLSCAVVSYRAHQYQQMPGSSSTHEQAIHLGNASDPIGSPQAFSGFKTFQDEIYFPVRSMITGGIPYSPKYQDFHPDHFRAVSTSPTVLALASPFGFLSLREAQWLYLCFCFFLAVLTARLLFRAGMGRAPWTIVLVVSGLMLISRPGMHELLGVGLVFPMVYGFAVALEYSKRRVFISGLGFLVTTCSLAFALPLAVLMMFRRDVVALGCGLLLTMVVWVSVGLVLAKGDLNELQRIAREDFGRQVGGIVERTEPSEVDQLCWDRIDLTPTVIKISRGDFFGDRRDGETEVAQDFKGTATKRVASKVSSVRFSFLPLAVFSKFPYNGLVGVGGFVLIACLAFGVICLLLEKRHSQRTGITSRSAVLIVLITLLACPHSVGDGVLVWVSLAGLLVGFRNLVVGLNWFVRFLVVVGLVVFVFNFLTPDSLRELGAFGQTILPDSWQMNVVASLNPILLMVAALLVGLTCLASQLSAGDPAKVAAGKPLAEGVDGAGSRRQQEWQKLKRK